MIIGSNEEQRTIANLIVHLDGLYRYALLFCHDPSDAEDLVHETYLSALKGVEIVGSDSNIKGWLYVTLRNIWLNKWKKSHTSPPTTKLRLDERNSGIRTIARASKGESERVRAALRQLPILFREIIMLRVYEDFSYQELAYVLDLPVETVSSCLARARQKLRALLFRTPDLHRKKATFNQEDAMSYEL